ILDEDIIRGAYPISIEADVINRCSGSKIWKVSSVNVAKDDEHDHGPSYKDNKKKDDDDDDDKKFVSIQIVTTNGEFNKPESCFQFVENDMMPGLQSYQIQHCPFKCGSSSTGVGCYNVGIISNADGNGYLGHTDSIFPVVFTNLVK
ncbi:proteinase inhibitor I3, partial [Tanacetum coccineum]